MDLLKAIRELQEEKQRLDEVIRSLEEFLQTNTSQERPAAQRRRGRKSMNPEERLKVSERMKNYWASKRGKTGPDS
jgi:hypothetical protein